MTELSFRRPKLPVLDAEDRRICRMIFDELCVLANGDIVCSCGDPSGKRVYGNVFRDRIGPVFDGEGYREMRRWQLAAEPSAWCPVIDQSCGGRVSRPSAADVPDGRAVRMLQLEPISRCNLECPACPVTHFESNPDYRSDRVAQLPLEVMLDVVDQLPRLEKILFYNFGEPFLHPGAIDFLREVRRRRPDVLLHTSTNGLAFTPAKIEAIARERLLDRIVFSIDGGTPESYARYRVGGALDRVLGNLEALIRATERAGTRSTLEIFWQYILFEWNDSDAEIDRARRIADGLGVPITWILTHTAGASRRFREGAPELRDVLGIGDPWSASTCDLRAGTLDRDRGVAGGKYRAAITTAASAIRAAAGSRFGLALRLSNLSGEPWKGDGFRLGIQLRRRGGGRISELASVPLLPHEIGARETALVYDTWAPATPGEYDLLVDVVEEGVTWFHERGSAPCVVALDVGPAVGPNWSSRAMADELAPALLSRNAARHEVEAWVRSLEQGVPVRTIAAWMFAAAKEGLRPERLARVDERIAASLAVSPVPDAGERFPAAGVVPTP